MTQRPDEERPVELGEVPDEEGVSKADAADRARLDPEDQENFTDRSSQPLGEPPLLENLSDEAAERGEGRS
jgi:hypothetical protein